MKGICAAARLHGVKDLPGMQIVPGAKGDQNALKAMIVHWKKFFRRPEFHPTTGRSPLKVSDACANMDEYKAAMEAFDADQAMRAQLGPGTPTGDDDDNDDNQD